MGRDIIFNYIEFDELLGRWHLCLDLITLCINSRRLQPYKVQLGDDDYCFSQAIDLGDSEAEIIVLTGQEDEKEHPVGIFLKVDDSLYNCNDIYFTCADVTIIEKEVPDYNPDLDQLDPRDAVIRELRARNNALEAQLEELQSTHDARIAINILEWANTELNLTNELQVAQARIAELTLENETLQNEIDALKKKLEAESSKGISRQKYTNLLRIIKTFVIAEDVADVQAEFKLFGDKEQLKLRAQKLGYKGKIKKYFETRNAIFTFMNTDRLVEVYFPEIMSVDLKRTDI